MSHQEWLERFDTVLKMHVGKGVTEFKFVADQKLHICRGGQWLENPQVTVTQPFFDAVIKGLIAHSQDRPVDMVGENEILQSLGGKMEYDVLIPSEDGSSIDARTFKAQITGAGSPSNPYTVEMQLDPPILLGFAEVMNPAQMSEEQLINWIDDFGTRMMQLKDPTPKDVIFHPNKRTPFITVTGGLRTINDVYIAPQGKPTEKIARALIKLAHSPRIDQELANNGGLLDALDLDLSYRTRAGRRFRVNIADTFDWEAEHGPLITMRLLPEKPFTMEDLGLSPVIREAVANIKMGLVLICGTTGSGKSTTMCAIIDFLLKSKSVNFLTIENPIETIFPSAMYPKSVITQRDVGKHARSQPIAMESAVRQSLNMAMVGEIRNAHDAMMALELAQSGHLIFATIHAGSVGESVGRVIDMFPSDQEKKIREMLATQYKMGLSQILVKGVKGQTELIMEIMKTNSDVKALITNTQDQDRMWSMREILEFYHHTLGTQSLDQCMVNLFKDKRINEDIMMFNSPDPDALLYRQNKLGIKLSSKWDPTGAELEASFDTLDQDMKEADAKRKIEEQKAKKKAAWDPLNDMDFGF